MDAITYLRSEHSHVKKALSVIKNAKNEKTKLTKFEALCKQLDIHEKSEEKVWYPVLKKHGELKEIISHLIAEEKHAAKAMKKLKATKYGIIWQLRFLKFSYDVNHHAKEEEKELFPKVRKLIDKKTLNDLGVKLKKFKTLHKK